MFVLMPAACPCTFMFSVVIVISFYTCECSVVITQQSEIMDMKEELIGDTIDDAIGADEEDEER